MDGMLQKYNFISPSLDVL